jgi:hypothetical protein
MTNQEWDDCEELSQLRSENKALKEQLAAALAENTKLAKQMVHAHWVGYKRSYLIGQPRIDEYKCSNCGCRRSVKSKYCKDCGALMDEEPPKEEKNDA